MEQRFDKEWADEQIELYGEASACQDEIVCPHCGYLVESYYDWYESAPYYDREEQCENCGEYFYLDCEPETYFNFTSRRKPL